MHRPVGAAVEAVVQVRKRGTVEAALVLTAGDDARQVLHKNEKKQKQMPHHIIPYAHKKKRWGGGEGRALTFVA